MGFWLFERGISWTSAIRHKSFDTDIPNPLAWTHWPNLGFNELHWAKPVQERRATGVQQWCVQLVGPRKTETWPSSNSGMKKHMKDRRLSLASQQLPLLLSYYRIRWLIFPAYASLVSNGTSKSSSLRKIHKDHTAYSSGEVYPSTFKMIKSSHLGNNFVNFFFSWRRTREYGHQGHQTLNCTLSLPIINIYMFWQIQPKTQLWDTWVCSWLLSTLQSSEQI